MPWIGFVFLMGHMSVNHIYRQFANDPSKVDITGGYKDIGRQSGTDVDVQEHRWCWS